MDDEDDERLDDSIELQPQSQICAEDGCAYDTGYTCNWHVGAICQRLRDETLDKNRDRYRF